MIMGSIRNNGQDSKPSTYILHTSVSEFSLLLLDIIIDDKAYGAVDYRILYENDISLFYLTKRGYKQASRLSERLADEDFFSGFIKDSKRLNRSLQSYSVPKLSKKNIVREWKRFLDIMNEFCRIYRFYEQPFQQALEQIVLRNIPEKDLVRLLHDPGSRSKENMSKDVKQALAKLVILGEMKLELHKNAEKIVTTYLMKFLAFGARKSRLPVEIMKSLRVKEFTQLLSGRYPDINAAKGRLKGCAIVKRGGKWRFEYGQKYVYWKNRIKNTQSQRIVGRVAYPGKVRGNVVLHQSWTGTIELKAGNILVTGMTNPQMVPYIRKAAAIVTDEGGITCHAAIIAREMRKPCITGTKNATQLLGNGDLVEVDANKGVVIILKKAREST